MPDQVLIERRQSVERGNERRHRTVRNFDQVDHGRAVGIGAGGTIILGIWLALSFGGYDLWDGWIIAALVLWVIAAAAGRHFARPATIERLKREGEILVPEASQLVLRLTGASAPLLPEAPLRASGKGRCTMNVAP